ncbi:MAG: dihydrodipicolinate synthase family protein [Halobacteriales archaeon]
MTASSVVNMDGIAPALVTPFDRDGHLDTERLESLVGWIEDLGVDFIVPCGSTGEAPLLTAEERRTVIEVVVGAGEVPVLAGTGHPGRRATVGATADAAEAGADAALVVTPFYYNHDQSTIEAYYRSVADASDIPLHLYSVPPFTDSLIEPETTGRLATHRNVLGMKDSSGDLTVAMRTLDATADAAFDLMIGNAAVLRPAVADGASGGILAIANVAPALASRAAAGDADAHRTLVELNDRILARHGIPGVKYAMRRLGAPAGHPRSPHRPLGDAARDAVDAALAGAGLR